LVARAHNDLPDLVGKFCGNILLFALGVLRRNVKDKEAPRTVWFAAAATFLAMDAPEKVGLIPGILQHASPEVSEQHYNLADVPRRPVVDYHRCGEGRGPRSPCRLTEPGKAGRSCVMLRATDINLVPAHDLVNCVVMQAGPANVDTVIDRDGLGDRA